jgi:hypothetical protein
MWIGALKIATIIISAQLWRMGGDGNSIWRLLVPWLLGAVLSVVHWNLFAFLYAPALWGMMALFSYGLSAPPHKFWVWVFGKGGDGNYKPVEVMTRATCGLAWSVPVIILSIIGLTSWWAAGGYMLFLTIANGLIGGLVEDVEISERGVGACVSSVVLI